MIVINKEDVQSIIVLSQLDKAYTSFKLSLYSDFTKREYTLDLGQNYSNSTSRYSQFVLQSSAFTDIASGEYEYSFIGDDDVLSFGLLVLSTTEDVEVYESVIPAITDNDFYVVQTN
jgi:hypothetical protein